MENAIDTVKQKATDINPWVQLHYTRVTFHGQGFVASNTDFNKVVKYLTTEKTF